MKKAFGKRRTKEMRKLGYYITRRLVMDIGNLVLLGMWNPNDYDSRDKGKPVQN
jgi:hypothetical protein